MAKNTFDDVVDRVLAALRQAPAVASLIEEDDDAPLAEGIGAAVLVRFLGSTPSLPAMHEAPVDWTTDLALNCHASADRESATGRASRALAAACYARLFADPSLGGAVFGMEPAGVAVEQERAAQTLGVCTLRLRFLHRTSNNSVEV